MVLFYYLGDWVAPIIVSRQTFDIRHSILAAFLGCANEKKFALVRRDSKGFFREVGVNIAEVRGYAGYEKRAGVVGRKSQVRVLVDAIYIVKDSAVEHHRLG